MIGVPTSWGRCQHATPLVIIIINFLQLMTSGTPQTKREGRTLSGIEIPRGGRDERNSRLPWRHRD